MIDIYIYLLEVLDILNNFFIFLQVICAVCKHVSVTYEPFMYLSVPLPRAMEKQLTVTYVPAYGARPIRCVVSLNKQSRVGKLKEELLHTLEKDTISLSNIALAEVLENRIAKVLVSIKTCLYIELYELSSKIKNKIKLLYITSLK